MRSLEQECVRLWQEAQCKMWMGRCGLSNAFFPDCTNIGTAGHHIIPRKYFLTKFELCNGIYVCTPCHNKIEDNPDYRNQMMEFVKERYPALYAWHETWRPKAKQTYGGWSNDDLKEIKIQLKGFIA